MFMCVCVCAFVCLCVTTHVKPARDHPSLDDLKISLICLPNTPHVHGGEAALARVYSLALQGPALIHLIDCMTCDGQLAVHRKLLLQGAL